MKSLSRRARLGLLAGVSLLGVLGTIAAADAQGFDPRTPRTVVVGAPKTETSMVRVTPWRDGRTVSALPTKKLHVDWRKATGAPSESPALVDETGRFVVVGVRGDVVFVGPEGDERGRVPTSTSTPGPPVLLGDGTVVFVTLAGDVVGVKGTSKRFGVRLGSGAAKVAPLPLRDGGVVVALGADLLVLDAEGVVRARAQAPEQLVGSLLGVGGKVVAASRTGAVFSWAPGGEVVRAGSFRATVDGNLVAEDAQHVLAVTDGTQLTELDLVRGATQTRAASTGGGLFLGPPALGPNGAVLFGSTFGTSYLVTLDRSGQEARTAIGAAPPQNPTLLPDGGLPPVVIPPHTGPLVDSAGTVAFFTPEGVVGVASRESGVSVLGEPPCGRPTASRAPNHPGLAPAGPKSFTVVCENGTLVRISGD